MKLEKLRFMLLVLVLTMISGSLHAAINAMRPEPGEKARDIYVIDSDRQQQSLEQLVGKRGLILVFFRSADWCPYCRRHLLELNKAAKKFRALGFNIAAVSYDKPDILMDFKEEFHISYSLLSDQQVKTISSWGLINHNYQPGDDHYGIPLPGVFVINKDLVIKQSYFYRGFKKRIRFNELYAHLLKNF